VWVAPSPAGRRNRINLSGSTHSWSKFGPGLCRAGWGRTTRMSYRVCHGPAWQPPRCDETLLAPALATKRQHAMASMSAQKFRRWPLNQATPPQLLCRLTQARAVAVQAFISWHALAPLPHAPPQSPVQSQCHKDVVLVEEDEERPRGVDEPLHPLWPQASIPATVDAPA
jgi:hypothetical protein